MGSNGRNHSISQVKQQMALRLPPTASVDDSLEDYTQWVCSARPHWKVKWLRYMYHPGYFSKVGMRYFHKLSRLLRRGGYALLPQAQSATSTRWLSATSTSSVDYFDNVGMCYYHKFSQILRQGGYAPFLQPQHDILLRRGHNNTSRT